MRSLDEQDAQGLLRQTGHPPTARDLPRDAIHRPTVELQVCFGSHAAR